MKYRAGFTVIELVFVITFLGLATGLILYQKAGATASQRDQVRKTAVNAMYYNLEEVVFKKANAYPEKIDAATLTAMDPELFTDPEGDKFGDPGSDYRYESYECQEGTCTGYTLRANLEQEADYVKKNRNT